MTADERKYLETLLHALRERAIRGRLAHPAWEVAYDLEAYLQGNELHPEMTPTAWIKKAEGAIKATNSRPPYP